MKLLRFDLKAVGPFTDFTLDLSAGDHGLHVIHGPNEAGKSSALRALSSLLFGFDRQTEDNFLHDYDRLRVGASLRRADGEILEFVRLKKNKDPLRSVDEKTPIAESLLERFLGGIDQARFESLFGIDHPRLIQAGEEIRSGRGHFGEMLFAAAAGLSTLSSAQRTLQEKLDELFKPRGQKQRITEALDEYEETQKKLRVAQLSSEDWKARDEALRAGLDRAKDLENKKKKFDVESNRLKRIAAALPSLTHRRELLDRLAERQNVPILRPSFGEDVRAAQYGWVQGESIVAETKTRLAEIEKKRLETPIAASDLLAEAQEIEELHLKLGGYCKAEVDRPQREEVMQSREHSARDILQELGRGRPRDVEADAESLRLRTDETWAIQNLGMNYKAVVQRLNDALLFRETHQAEINRLTVDLEALGDPIDAEPLRGAIRLARKAGDLDEELAEARSARIPADKNAAKHLKKLQGWNRSLEELERLEIPLDETIDRFEIELADAGRVVADLGKEIDRKTADLRKDEVELADLERNQDLPTEQDLLSARATRDDGWRLVRHAWLDKAAVDAQRFIDEFSPRGTLADGFEKSISRCDDLADRLRREAERVERKSAALDRIVRAKEHLESLEVRRAEAEKKLAEVQGRWQSLRNPLCAAVEVPAELRSWLRKREAVVQLAEEARDARLAEDRRERAVAEQRTRVVKALREFDESATFADSTLAEVLDRAEQILKRLDDQSKKREKWNDQLTKEQRGCEQNEEKLGVAERELNAWRADWTLKMERIGLPADALPDQANLVLDRIKKLFELLKEAGEFRSRVKGMVRDAEQFTSQVRALTDRVAADLTEVGPADQVKTLWKRLSAAIAADRNARELLDRENAERTALKKAEADRSGHLDRLRLLATEAGRESPDELAEAERLSNERARLENDLAVCENQIRARSAGATVGDFAAEAEPFQVDELESRIAELGRAVDAIDTELTEVNRSIGTEREKLGRMNGGDAAAGAAEKAQTILATIRADVARYAALKLSWSVLQRGIERYREKSQGPILSRGSQLFADLTGGSFTRLQIDQDDKGQAILKGVRPDGKSVGVEGMSDGSHDQLYLALRLAALESWLKVHEPIPFVIDDILLNFDDARATAALRALAELSRSTQVLFFTHHRHVVDLARANLSDKVLFVHELPASRGGQIAKPIPPTNSTRGRSGDDRRTFSSSTVE